MRFLVNGTEVTSQPRSAVDTDGITGLRITHLLDLHIGDLNLGDVAGHDDKPLVSKYPHTASLWSSTNARWGTAHADMFGPSRD